MGYDGKERRRLKRVVKRIPIRFEAGGLRGQGHIKNLTKEGLYIRSHLLPEPGTGICVEIVSHDGSKVEIRAVVRWTTAQLRDASGTPGFGVMIEQPTPEFLEFFELLLLR